MAISAICHRQPRIVEKTQPCHLTPVCTLAHHRSMVRFPICEMRGSGCIRVGKPQPVGQTLFLYSLWSKNSFYIFRRVNILNIYILKSVHAFMLRGPRWIGMTETRWPAKSNTMTLWPFVENLLIPGLVDEFSNFAAHPNHLGSWVNLDRLRPEPR